MSFLIITLPIVVAIAGELFRIKWLSSMSLIIMTTLLLLRADVGFDYENYERITRDLVPFHFSPLSDALNSMAYSISFPNGFMGLSALLQGVIIYAATKISSPRYLSIFLFLSSPYFYIESYSLVRQMNAICLCVLAFAFLEARQKKYALIAYTFAILSHVTALTGLLIFLNKIENFRLKVFYSGITLIVFSAAYFLILQNSALFTLYDQYELSGDYYIILSMTILLPYVLIFRDRQSEALLLMIATIMVSFFFGYVFNRALVYLCIPFLFIKKTRDNFNFMLVGILFFLIYCAAFYVKLREPLNGFSQFNLIF